MDTKTEASPTITEAESSDTSEDPFVAQEPSPAPNLSKEERANERANEKALLLAADLGLAKTIRKLVVNKRVDVNTRDEYTGQTALHKAVQQDNAKLCEFLIQAGASVNAQDQESGQTPLHEAVRNMRGSLVHLLLKKRADPNVMDSSRMIPLDYLFPEESSDALANGDDSTVSSAHGFTVSSSQHSSGQSISTWRGTRNMFARRLRQPSSARRVDAERQSIGDLLMSSGSFPPKGSFYLTLFSFDIRKGVDAWLERIRLSIKNIHDCRIFYTLLSAGEGVGLVTAAQTRNLTSEFVTDFCEQCHTIEACQQLSRLISHAENRNRIDKSAASFARSFLSSCDTDPLILEPNKLQQCIRKASKDVRVVSGKASKILQHLTDFRDACFQARELRKRPNVNTTKDEVDGWLVKGVMGLISAILCGLVSRCEHADAFQTLCQKTFDFLDNQHLDEVILYEDLEQIGGAFNNVAGGTFIASPQNRVDLTKLRCGARVLGFCADAFRRLRKYMDEGVSPLHSECCQKDFSTTAIRSIVVAHPGMVCERDPDGCLPLHRICLHSVESNKEEFQGAILEAIDILTSDDSAVQTADYRGRTALHYACMAPVPQYAVVNSLVTKYPSAVVQRDEYGFLPLHLACKREKVSYTTIKKLLPSLQDREVMQHQVTLKLDAKSTPSAIDEIVTHDETEGKTISAGQSMMEESKETLSLTEDMGNLTTKYRVLPEGSTRAWYETGEGDTLTTLAVRHRLSCDVINLIDAECPALMEAETHLSQIDSQRYKLHYLIKENDHKSFVRQLRSVFCKVNEVDSQGRSPLDLAAAMGRVKQFELLVENSARSNLYGSAHKLGNLLKVREMTYCPMREGRTDETTTADMSNDDGSASTLSVCSQTEETEFEHAVVSEADQASLPLHKAINENDLDGFFDALEGTNMNIPDSEGRSPLELSALQGREEMFETLCERGAKPSMNQSINVLRAVLEVRVRCRLRRATDDSTAHTSRPATEHPTEGLESQSPGLFERRGSLAYLRYKDAYLSTKDASRLPLHKAVMDSAPEVILSFDGDEAIFNEVDSKGRSPLDFAAFTGQPQLFELLLARGSQPAALPSVGALRVMLQMRAPRCEDDQSTRSTRSSRSRRHGSRIRAQQYDNRSVQSTRSGTRRTSSSRRKSSDQSASQRRSQRKSSAPHGRVADPDRAHKITSQATETQNAIARSPVKCNCEMGQCACGEPTRHNVRSVDRNDFPCKGSGLPHETPKSGIFAVDSMKSERAKPQISTTGGPHEEKSSYVKGQKLIETVFTVQHKANQSPAGISGQTEQGGKCASPDGPHSTFTHDKSAPKGNGNSSRIPCHVVRSVDEPFSPYHGQVSKNIVSDYSSLVSKTSSGEILGALVSDPSGLTESQLIESTSRDKGQNTSSVQEEGTSSSSFFQDALLPEEAEDKFPLHKAIKQGSRRELLQLLRQNKSDPQGLDSWGRSPLDFAAMTGQRDLFEILYKRGVKPAKFASVDELQDVLDRREPYMEEYYLLH